MEKYNKLLANITELIEKGLFTSKHLKKYIENLIKFRMEVIANKLNLVSREEFEVQKKMLEKLLKDLIKYKFHRKKNKSKKKNYKGKETLTLSPFKGLFSKEILPPCERIISFAIDKPKPTPALFCPLLLSIL